MVVKDHFTVLGLSHDATDDQVRAAYKSLAKKWHPDKNRTGGAEDKFKEVLAAYTCLKVKSDRDKYLRDEVRTKYDTTATTTTTKTQNTSSEPRRKSSFDTFGTGTNKTGTGRNKSGTTDGNRHEFHDRYDRYDSQRDESDAKPHKTYTSTKNGFTDGRHKFTFFQDDDTSHTTRPKSKTPTRTTPKPKWDEKWNEAKRNRKFEDFPGFEGAFMSDMAQSFLASFMRNGEDGWPIFMPVNITDIPTFRKQFAGLGQRVSELDDEFGFGFGDESSDDDRDAEPKMTCAYCNKRLPLLELKRHEPVCRELQDVVVKQPRRDPHGDPIPRSTGNWRDTHEQLLEGIRQAKKTHHVKTPSPSTELRECAGCRLKFSPDSFLRHACKGKPLYSRDRARRGGRGNTYTPTNTRQNKTKLDESTSPTPGPSWRYTPDTGSAKNGYDTNSSNIYNHLANRRETFSPYIDRLGSYCHQCGRPYTTSIYTTFVLCRCHLKDTL